MSTKIERAVKSVVRALEDATTPRRMSISEYVEVLDALLEDLAVRKELAEDDLKRQETGR